MIFRIMKKKLEVIVLRLFQHPSSFFPVFFTPLSEATWPSILLKLHGYIGFIGRMGGE